VKDLRKTGALLIHPFLQTRPWSVALQTVAENFGTEIRQGASSLSAII
jgi:hypothetical protein